jgi:hypothetical protein
MENKILKKGFTFIPKRDRMRVVGWGAAVFCLFFFFLCSYDNLTSVRRTPFHIRVTAD